MPELTVLEHQILLLRSVEVLGLLQLLLELLLQLVVFLLVLDFH